MIGGAVARLRLGSGGGEGGGKCRGNAEEECVGAHGAASVPPCAFGGMGFHRGIGLPAAGRPWPRYFATRWHRLPADGRAIPRHSTGTPIEISKGDACRLYLMKDR